MKDPFDLEKEAEKAMYSTIGSVGRETSIRDDDWNRALEYVKAFGRLCADEALERAAVDCERDGKRITAENIRGLKSTPAAEPETERDQNALWRAERELEKS